MRTILNVIAVPGRAVRAERPLLRSARGAVVVLALLGVAACGGGSGGSGTTASAEGAAGKLTVVATTTQVADFARNVGGDRVEVVQLVKPNVDPHDYEPSPADVQALAEADVVVQNGVGLERWLDQLVTASGFTGARVDTSAGITLRRGGESDEDPHIWHDPRNAQVMSRNIATALETARPADASVFRANLAGYTRELQELDSWIQQQIDSVPAADRKLVTNHDAFGYYVDRYRLTFVGSIIPSFDTSAELSGKELGELVARIKATGVTAVFSESSLPPRTAETLGREAGVRVVAGEDSLYGDTLGPAGSAGATYLDMERHNTTTIVTALKA
jgi:zinc/manganese transport system substrate-binding protein/manganese/iron transport system substrate-binding protein